MKKNNRFIIGSFLCVALMAVIVASVLFVNAGGEPVENAESKMQMDSVKVVTYPYDIPTEHYTIHRDVVKSGENLSGILADFGLSSQEVHNLNEKSDSVFDVRRIKAGQSYAVYLAKDSLASASFLVYEENPISYVVFDLRDSMKVIRGEKPVTWKKKEIKGSVESSLWAAMQKKDASPQLAMALSDIFGWTIDFFGIQEGDEFRVIYEQKYVEDEPLLDFHVMAASFCASDSLYYAIPFIQDGKELYFNDKGESLESNFLKAPLDFYRITSRFTNSRYHPVLKRYRAHHGVDYAAPVGTPVYAIGRGKVIAKGYQANGGGNFIKIKHDGSYMTSYMHLSRFANGLKVGSEVEQKEVIGYVGSTGLSTGPHLDFRIYENGRPINPLTVKSNPKRPVDEADMKKFMSVCDSLKASLLQL